MSSKTQVIKVLRYSFKNVYLKLFLVINYLFLSLFVVKFKGEFVEKNGAEMGDSLTIYEDESKNLVSTLINSLFLILILKTTKS